MLAIIKFMILKSIIIIWDSYESYAAARSNWYEKTIKETNIYVKIKI